MNKPMKLLIITFTVFVFVLTSCNIFSKPTFSLPDTMPKDFGFVLDYGVLEKNQLDTIKGTYTKDLILAPQVTTDLVLSDTKMAEIYQMMKDIDILSYPETYTVNSDVHMTPYQSYSITITYDGKTKSIHWDDESGSDETKALKLRELFARIHEIVSETAQYKQLPEAQGGYD